MNRFNTRETFAKPDPKAPKPSIFKETLYRRTRRKVQENIEIFKALGLGSRPTRMAR